MLHRPDALHPRPGWVDDLRARYATPGRHHHTFAHVEEVLGHWQTVRAAGAWRAPETPWVAILLHDAVYDVGAPDNEARSAALVEPWCAAWLPERVDITRATAFIAATAHHGEPVDDPDLALFLDCDMAVLGASPERFARYERDIRAEWVPVVGVEAYEHGRRRFLEGLLARPIFQSAFWRDRLEDAARRNVLAQLDAATSPPATSGIQ